ncbi:MAG: zf-TFIIB domain-containing protein [Sandaracinaceae bacterium]|nr:zf-TFIIB domain-containing protein [Sandaracinaceae bacterium]
MATDPQRALNCPRCMVVMREARARGGAGGAYREAWTMVWQCNRCKGQLLEASDSGNLAQSLARSMLVRNRKKAPALCPACMTNLIELTLGWDDVSVEIEECPGCFSVFVDRGELEQTRTLMRAAAGLQATDLSVHGGTDEPDPFEAFLRSLGETLDGLG